MGYNIIDDITGRGYLDLAFLSEIVDQYDIDIYEIKEEILHEINVSDKFGWTAESYIDRYNDLQEWINKAFEKIIQQFLEEEHIQKYKDIEYEILENYFDTKIKFNDKELRQEYEERKRH